MSSCITFLISEYFYNATQFYNTSSKNLPSPNVLSSLYNSPSNNSNKYTNLNYSTFSLIISYSNSSFADTCMSSHYSQYLTLSINFIFSFLKVTLHLLYFFLTFLSQVNVVYSSTLVPPTLLLSCSNIQILYSASRYI